MDSTLDMAARALAQGDVLRALNLVARRDDPDGLALRGVAMARMGDLRRARELLRAARARMGSAPVDRVAAARCQVALAEVQLALRDLHPDDLELDAAAHELRAHGDRDNECFAGVLGLRRALLLGDMSNAHARAQALDVEGAPPGLRAVHGLAVAELAIRRTEIASARRALAAAREFAREAGILALESEVELAGRRLDEPVARVCARGVDRVMAWDEVESVLAGPTTVVNRCRRSFDGVEGSVPLARRPILFGLLWQLAAAHPKAVSRDRLIARVFEAPCSNESLRARLRVEIGRLRRSLGPSYDIAAADAGYRLVLEEHDELVTLSPIDDTDAAALIAVLGDGAAWSTSGLALALDAGQRTVQRELAQLEAQGRVRSHGRGRSRRWLAIGVTGYATALLLPPRVVGG